MYGVGYVGQVPSNCNFTFSLFVSTWELAFIVHFFFSKVLLYHILKGKEKGHDSSARGERPSFHSEQASLA